MQTTQSTSNSGTHNLPERMGGGRIEKIVVMNGSTLRMVLVDGRWVNFVKNH